MFYIFHFKINTLLCYTVVSVLVLGIGIARGHYWILDIGCFVWYRSNPTAYLSLKNCRTFALSDYGLHYKLTAFLPS